MSSSLKDKLCALMAGIFFLLFLLGWSGYAQFPYAPLWLTVSYALAIETLVNRNRKQEVAWSVAGWLFMLLVYESSVDGMFFVVLLALWMLTAFMILVLLILSSPESSSSTSRHLWSNPRKPADDDPDNPVNKLEIWSALE